MSKITNIQACAGAYKITTENNFYYLSKDRVSKFKSEAEHDDLVGSNFLNYNSKYKGCFEELEQMLEEQQDECSWIKDAYEIVTNYERGFNKEKKDEFPCFRKSALGTIVKFTGVKEGITVPLDGTEGVHSNNFWRYDDETFWTPCDAPVMCNCCKTLKKYFRKFCLNK